MQIKKILAQVLLISAFALSLNAEEGFEEIQTLGVQRNEIEINPYTQELTRIVSIGEAQFAFDKPSDIQKAAKVAEMRAKAAISQYLSQEIASQDSIEEITKNLSEQNSSSAEQLSQKSISTLIEKIQNNSQAVLSGIVVLSTQVNKDKKVVRVTLGFNKNNKQNKAKNTKYADF